jgi:hypothetical protein
MVQVILSLFVICIFFIDPTCHAQTKVRVSDPGLEDEKYIISIDIKDENGNPIDANALIGDIGIVEEGGTNKLITWNLESDNIFLDAYVFVQINANVIPPPVPVITEPEEEIVEEVTDNQKEAHAEEIKKQDVIIEDKPKATESERTTNAKETSPVTRPKNFNRVGIVIQSLALPGLGLSRTTGKPHWLRGAAGYGCLAGSIILNRTAVNTFNEVEDFVRFDEINEAYNKSSRQDNISEILAYTAVGIWVTDFIWTLVGTSDLKRSIPYTASRGLSFKGDIDPLSNVPRVSIRYRF